MDFWDHLQIRVKNHSYFHSQLSALGHCATFHVYGTNHDKWLRCCSLSYKLYIISDSMTTQNDEHQAAQRHVVRVFVTRIPCGYFGDERMGNDKLVSWVVICKKRKVNPKTFDIEMCDVLINEEHESIKKRNAVEHTCEVCQKTFLRKDNLTRHVNTI